MANTSRVNGFRPVKYLNGAPWNGQVTRYSIPASDGTALFVGDLVKASATADSEGVRGVIQAAASDAVLGVVVGFESSMTNLDTPQYRVASTLRYALVVDDPNVIFEAQEDGATDPLEMVDAGLNVDFVVGAGSTTTGASGMQIDSNTEAVSATLPLKLLEPVKRPDNELVAAGQAYTRWLVKINNHQLGSHTGTAGV
jgi:hypothetical protein